MDRFTGRLTEGHEAGLSAFADDADEAGVEVDIFEAGVAEFRHAEATGVEEFEHGAVAEAERVTTADAVDEASHVGFVESFRKVLFWPWERKGLGGV